MTVDAAIFKDYEIEGIYPDQINGDVAYRIGMSLPQVLKTKGIAVGRNISPSSNDIFDILVRGINDAGADVFDLGLISTDSFHFAVGRYGWNAGVMITGGHSQKEDNSISICRQKGEPIYGQSGLDKIYELLESGTELPKSPAPGVVVRKDITLDFARHCLSLIESTKLKPYKAVIDASNGTAAITLPPALERLPIEVTPLNFEFSSGAPGNPDPPVEREKFADLKKQIAQTGADIGVVFDADTECMILFDSNGAQLGGDAVTAIVARSLLNKYPGETILYNLICSRAVPELIRKMGGTSIRSKVGAATIKPLMKKHNAIFAGEHSGRFYFRENWFANSGLIALLLCLEIMSKENSSLESLVSNIVPYYRSGEISSRVDSVDEVTTRVREAFSDGDQDELDGLTVQYDEYWFNLRPSNTEPVLKLNVEAVDAALLKEKTNQILQMVRA